MVGEKLVAIRAKQHLSPSEWADFYVITDCASYRIGIDQFVKEEVPADAEEFEPSVFLKRDRSVEIVPNAYKSRIVVEIRINTESVDIVLDDGSQLSTCVDYDGLVPFDSSGEMNKSFLNIRYHPNLTNAAESPDETTPFNHEQESNSQESGIAFFLNVFLKFVAVLLLLAFFAAIIFWGSYGGLNVIMFLLAAPILLSLWFVKKVR